MTEVIFIAIGLMVLGEVISALSRKNPQRVVGLHAGGTRRKMTGMKPWIVNYEKEYALADGRRAVIDNIKFKIFHIAGKCLNPLGFVDNAVAIAEMFDPKANDEEKRAKIKDGDILLIHWVSWGFVGYKAREFDGEWIGDAAKTYYYDDEGTKQESKYLHDLGLIVGVMRKTESRIESTKYHAQPEAPTPKAVAA